jgi:outer membrane protein OmpA-like peptidoglycan-associated protein
MNTTRSIARLIAALALVAAPAGAVTLNLPQGANLVLQQENPGDGYALPIAPWDGTQVPSRMVEGQVTRQVWRLDQTGLTVLQILAPLRDQLAADGYEILLDCAAKRCGGFDFRFGTEVFPAPEMFVDLTRFRFLSASKGDDHVSVLVSRGLSTGYVQVIRVGASARKAIKVTEVPKAQAGPTGPLSQELETAGHVVLGDLVFETGSANLGQERFATLDSLAAYLAANPGRRVALVGHTDSVGALSGNIVLSKRRAQSVVDRLVSDYGVDRSQVLAEGMGWLAPRASNLTEGDREANRRVEAVLISVE